MTWYVRSALLWAFIGAYILLLLLLLCRTVSHTSSAWTREFERPSWDGDGPAACPSSLEIHMQVALQTTNFNDS
jgi:hypothetical protein